jgi:ABC-type Zn uptake system ZnuABC Zn-binding protein ZnuA
MNIKQILLFLTLLTLTLSACQPQGLSSAQPTVLAIEPFLADLTRNVVGDRMVVESLIPSGLDPHSFEPTPQDIARLSSASILVQNGAGLEEWLEDFLENNPSDQRLITASDGLTSRTPQPGEIAHDADEHAHEGDPHFWLDPLNAIRYVENIRDGLIAADPAGAEVYTQNAQSYILQLQQLDEEIRLEIETIPPERRLLVTNHESFGYFADRYQFRIIGAIIPSVSSGASPSAKDLAALVDAIQASQAPAIFLETGSNPQLARQIASETGTKVVTELYTHSLSQPDGPAASYLEMMRSNSRLIVEALK